MRVRRVPGAQHDGRPYPGIDKSKYSEGLASLVAWMLTTDGELRPSTQELLSSVLVRRYMLDLLETQRLRMDSVPRLLDAERLRQVCALAACVAPCAMRSVRCPGSLRRETLRCTSRTRVVWERSHLRCPRHHSPPPPPLRTSEGPSNRQWGGGCGFQADMVVEVIVTDKKMMKNSSAGNTTSVDTDNSLDNANSATGMLPARKY